MITSRMEKGQEGSGVGGSVGGWAVNICPEAQTEARSAASSQRFFLLTLHSSLSWGVSVLFSQLRRQRKFPTVH